MMEKYPNCVSQANIPFFLYILKFVQGNWMSPQLIFDHTKMNGVLASMCVPELGD